ncbi:MAG TPA: hypothetical protein VIR98_02070 [Candidatus Paceibacterota bacterium]|jgi:hypothetical protein
MFESDKRSPLDRAKKSLYSRNIPDTETPRHDIHEPQVVAPTSWDGGAPDNPVPTGDVPAILPATHRKVYKVAFFVSAAFLLMALAVAAYTFFGGGNFISVDNVDISIEGPAQIAGGEELGLTVSVFNKNTTAIRLVDLIADYPEGAKDPQDPAKDLGHVRVRLGDIDSQSVSQRLVSALMYGEEGSQKEIKFTAEYQAPGSNAIFYKEKVYKVTVSSSPILVSVDAPDKVLSDIPVDVTVTIASNSTMPVKDLLLSLDYPFGMTVVSADPAATYGGTVWRIGDLAPGSKRTVKLRVTATGQDAEERALRATVGIQDASNEREIATAIVSTSHTLSLERPFLGMDLSLDGERSDLSIQSGQNVRADLIWTNNSTDRITDIRIVAKLSGNALDKSSVSVSDGGYYDSLSNSIIWERGRVDGFDSAAPGDEGRIGFTLVPRGTSANSSVRIDVSASGTRSGNAGVPEEIQSATSRQIKLVSNLSLSSRALHSQGPITNTGPIPPKAEEATTYTIVWTATNTTNPVTGARVSATLPPYAKWMGVTSPTDANITYDEATGAVSWLVGELPRNADIGSGAKQVAFQISFTPSANQVGTAPELLSASAISGTDTFTNAILQNSAGALTTRITTDLLYKAGDETVR